jgi:general secretion pathway protein I
MLSARPISGARRASAAGFTLLEVMVAVAVVAIALVPLLRLHLLSLDATARAQDLTQAVFLAQEKIASIRSFPDAGEEQGTFERPELSRFRWYTVVTEDELVLASSAKPIAVRRIVVIITWADGQRERQYTLESYALR